jgi:hypothetical protein
MGEIIWQQGRSGLAVSTYLHPAQPADVSMTRVQVTTVDGQPLQLNLAERADLCSACVSLPESFPGPIPRRFFDDARE